jgi:uncharacterized protein YbjT (DUF2867 family)
MGSSPSKITPKPLATAPTTPVEQRVLVLCATGKIGRNACKALSEAGFDVYGTTRGAGALAAGTPIVCDYTDPEHLAHAFKESGAKKVFSITDFFGAAKSNPDLEFQHGKIAIDAAKAAGVEHLVFVSVVDADKAPAEVVHFHPKLKLETYLKSSGLAGYSILRPTCFYENLDDAANWNPLKKGHLKFLMLEKLTWTSTFDIGRAAAAMFKAPAEWQGKTLDVVSWQGDLAQVAAGLAEVSGEPVGHSLAMPIFARRMFLNDLHHMCEMYVANGGGAPGSIEAFKKVVPSAMTPADFFRFHGKYADGTKIAK